MDTGIPQHPKIMALVHDNAWRAISVWHFAVEWCGSAGTAGFIPHYALPAIHARTADMAKLVEVELLALAAGGWQLHNYGERNCADAEAVRRSERASKAATVRWHGKRKSGGHLRAVDES